MRHEELSVPLVRIPVRELPRAVDYYQRVLGLEAEYIAEASGWAQFRAGGLTLCLYVCGMGENDRAPGGGVDFDLAVNDLPGLRARLSERGACIAGGVLSMPGGRRCMDIVDPDGNILRIVERRVPATRVRAVSKRLKASGVTVL